MSETKTQAVSVGRIDKVGMHDDKFYIYARVKDTVTNREVNALVRLKTPNEIKEFYSGIYPDKDNSDLNTTTTSFLENQGDKRELQKGINEFIAKGIAENRFHGNDYADIMENQLAGMPFYIRNAKIIGELPTSDNKGQPSSDPNANDNNTIKIMTAQTILGFGVKLGEEAMENLEAVDPSIENTKIEEGLAKFEYTPPTDTSEDGKVATNSKISDFQGKSASTRVFKVTDVENFNAFQIQRDNRDFEKTIYSALKPMSDSDSPENFSVNKSRMEVNLTFDIDGLPKTHRLTFFSNNLYGNELYDLSYDSRKELALNEKESYDTQMDEFIQMRDPYSQAKNPSDKVLAKNDILRIMMLASRQPNKFEEFREKVTNKDPSAFEGVTKKNYMDIKNPNEYENLVMAYSDAVADNPRRVLHNISVDKQLNLGDTALNEITQNLTASFYKHANESRIDSSGKVSAIAKATNAKHNAAFDIFNQGEYGLMVKQIPVLISTQEIPVENGSKGTDINGDENDPKIETITSHLMVSKYNFAPNPKSEDGKGKDYKYDEEHSLTQYNHTHASPKLFRRSTGKIDVRAPTVQVDFLVGVGPDVQAFPDIMVHPDKDKDFGGNYIPKNELLGVMTLPKYDGEVDNKDEFKVVLSEGPAGERQHKVLSHYFFMNNFEKDFLNNHVPKLDANGDPNEERIRLQSRFNEMMETIQDVIGVSFKQKLDYPNEHTQKIIRPFKEGETELPDPKYQKAREMLLGDKMVEHNGKEYNYSDVMYKMTNPRKYTPQPIQSDVADVIEKPSQSIPFEKTSTYKQDRVVSLAKEQQEKLVQETKPAEDFANDIIAEYESKQVEQEQTPRLRV